MIVTNGRRRKARNAQTWGMKNDSHDDGNCTSRDFRFGNYRISGRKISVGLSVRIA